jgi:uncharacterized phiE125 gp8 family phage protein
MTPFQLIPPAIEPVSLDEQKAWLRVDDASEDNIVASLIETARALVESATHLSLITRTWRFTLDEWPRPAAPRGQRSSGGVLVRLPIAPFQSVAAIRILDALGNPRDIAASAYETAPSRDGARVLFNVDPPAPAVGIGGISIDVVAGFGDAPSAVPEPLRLAIKMLAARWFENRGDIETDAAADRLPQSVGALVAPFRRARLA